jgi:hypothetical protein
VSLASSIADNLDLNYHGRIMKPVVLSVLMFVAAGLSAQSGPSGFVSLFNGRDLAGWKVPDGDNGHWKVVDGVIDYDAQSEAAKDKNLWSEKSYRDFVFRVDWRIKATPYRNRNARIVMPDGSDKMDENGKVIQIDVPDSDSGILLRGTGKAQVNIWCWPVGSGEFYGYRTDRTMPQAIKAAVTPKVNADKNIGEWNTFEITMRGDRVTVVLNGKTVVENAQLPGVPAEGRIGLQHHGGFRDGKYTGPPSLLQFRNISIKEL